MFKTNITVKDFEQMLDDRFVKVHRACIVNKDKIVKIDKTKKNVPKIQPIKVKSTYNKYQKAEVYLIYYMLKSICN